MGYHATRWVVENYHQNGSKKLAMIILAFHADEHGECYPATGTLAREIGVNERQVRLVMRQLETAGDIAITTGGGRRTNTYRILGFINSLKNASSQPTKKRGLTHHSPEKTPSGGALTTPLDDMHASESLHEITPLGGYPQQGWEDSDNLSGGLSTTAELTYNNPLSTIKENKTMNYVVAPVGDNHAPAPLPKLELTTPEGKDTHQSQEAVKPIIEELPRHTSSPQTNSVNNTTSPTNPPPIAPPRADKVRHLTDHQQMVGAIVKAFGWSFNKMTKNNRGLVGKVARELREASATPDQIPALYEFCKGQKWSSDIFTPSALSKQWANFCATQDSSGGILPPWTPPPGYVGVKFDYPKPPIYDPQAQPDSDATEELTPAQMREQLAEILKKFAQKMTIEELPMSEDDPMNEVLTW